MTQDVLNSLGFYQSSAELLDYGNLVVGISEPRSYMDLILDLIKSTR